MAGGVTAGKIVSREPRAGSGAVVNGVLLLSGGTHLLVGGLGIAGVCSDELVQEYNMAPRSTNVRVFTKWLTSRKANITSNASSRSPSPINVPVTVASGVAPCSDSDI